MPKPEPRYKLCSLQGPEVTGMQQVCTGPIQQLNLYLCYLRYLERNTGMEQPHTPYFIANKPQRTLFPVLPTGSCLQACTLTLHSVLYVHPVGSTLYTPYHPLLQTPNRWTCHPHLLEGQNAARGHNEQWRVLLDTWLPGSKPSSRITTSALDLADSFSLDISLSSVIHSTLIYWALQAKQYCGYWEKSMKNTGDEDKRIKIKLFTCPHMRVHMCRLGHLNFSKVREAGSKPPFFL